MPEIIRDNKFFGSLAKTWSVLETDVAYLHHTSGTSTGLPKPIPQTHRAAVGVLPWTESNSETATFTTTPLYHGGIADCFRSWTSGAMIWLFPGRDIPVTAANVFNSLNCAGDAYHAYGIGKVTYFSSVPYVLDMIVAVPGGYECLRQMTLVGVGGAALSPNVGDEIVQHGVNLVSRFGSAECGFVMSSNRDYTLDIEWSYLRSNGSPHLFFEPQPSGLSELIMRPTWPHMAKRNRDDGSYATADLFERHHTIQDAWRYHSRADSQLTLVTGKKFDPAPLEAAIAYSRFLNECLIFGNGQQYPGALLFRSTISADMTSEEVLDAVWPMVGNLNSESQAHTRLSRSMLVVMPKDAPGLEKSSKGTTMRAAAEKKYGTVIRNAYEHGANPSTNGKSPAIFTDENVAVTVLEIVKGAIGIIKSIPRDADLFSFGVDSVACMQIRASLQILLLPANAPKLPLNIVYDCGTIQKIAEYILTTRHGGKFETGNEIGEMLDLVKEYSTFKPATSARSASVSQLPNDFSELVLEGDVVILTGATGALGAHILDQLRGSPRISKIHCLVRAANSTTARARVSRSLKARNKAPLEKNFAAQRITCHPCNLADSRLGLDPPNDDVHFYTSLASQATVVIHAAWAVNFTMRLSSFVTDHIAGLQNLITFALASPHPSPPRFIFCSSTASVLGPNVTSPIPEEISQDPESASPLGYSRSKWVAEAICEQAHLTTTLRDRISVLRVGQLCGDTESGIWNVTEAWPLMLSSVSVTKSLPDLKDALDWLPVDIAAQAIMEIAMPDDSQPPAYSEVKPNTSQQTPVYHILNPATHPTWTSLLSWLLKLYPDFDILPPATWVARLDSLRGENAEHPARKLLGLWKDAYASDDASHSVQAEGEEEGEEYGGGEEKGEAKACVAFIMERTKEAVSVMRDVRPVDEELFEKIWGWVERAMIGGDVSDV
jgi:thioester reductase-like protein